VQWLCHHWLVDFLRETVGRMPPVLRTCDVHMAVCMQTFHERFGVHNRSRAAAHPATHLPNPAFSSFLLKAKHWMVSARFQARCTCSQLGNSFVNGD
jgi:hypothetical protein